MQLRFLSMVSACALVGAALVGCADGVLPGRTGDLSPAGGVPSGALVLSGTCNASAASDAIGRPATAALQSELITKTLAKTLRVVRVGEPVTQDFSSQRLNLEVDGTGRITSVRCG